MVTYPSRRGRGVELRRGRVSDDYACYSITKAVRFRRPVLATDSSAEILLSSWQFLRKRERIKVFAFCIMPDHYHLVLCLMPGQSLSKVMEDTGKFTAHELNKLLQRQGQFWQDGFHDHRCRNEIELHDLCLYAEHNPVRKELVIKAEEWPYSSAHRANQRMVDREWWP